MKKIFAVLAGLLVMGSTAVLADESDQGAMPQQEGQQQADAAQDNTAASKPAKKHHGHHHHHHHHKHKHHQDQDQPQS